MYPRAISVCGRDPTSRADVSERGDRVRPEQRAAAKVSTPRVGLAERTHDSLERTSWREVRLSDCLIHAPLIRVQHTSGHNPFSNPCARVLCPSRPPNFLTCRTPTDIFRRHILQVHNLRDAVECGPRRERGQDGCRVWVRGRQAGAFFCRPPCASIYCCWSTDDD